MRNWYLPNGSLYRDGTIRTEDVLVVDGVIAAFGEQAKKRWQSQPSAFATFEYEDGIIARGFIDLHVHLRQPGDEHKETIASGTKAAARGGFTSVYAMPNTKPPLDSVERLRSFNRVVQQEAVVRAQAIAALSKGRKGTELVDYNGLAKGGVVLFSDDGDPASDKIIRRSMEEIAKLNGVVINHLEDKSLTNGGVFHPDIPAESEYRMLERDLRIVAETGCRYHAAHLSCAESVRLIQEAKDQGLPVTAEVCPHHLVLTCDNIKQPKGNYQMKPPLRTEQDRQALIKGLADGVIDCVATDHAPHGNEKESEFSPGSPFGVTGLETVFSALYTNLVLTQEISLVRLLEALTQGPAAVCGEPGELRVGHPADLVVIDLEQTQVVKADTFYSKGTNSPFIGEQLVGWPVFTLVGGEERYRCR